VADGMLTAMARAGESGPVILLAGEADLTCAGELSALITEQLANGTQELTVDVSGLRFADTSAIRALVLADRTLKERGGRLVLLNPQRAVYRVLTLLGADQMFPIVGEPRDAP
jgi:anti-sigma B factor antagonist